MIKVRFPDATVKEFESGITGMDIAKIISPKLAKNSIALKKDAAVTDLMTPLSTDTSIQFLSKTDSESLELIRHSTAHLLAYAVQEDR